MNITVKLMYEKQEEGIRIYASKEDGEKISEDIIINTEEKTITNIKDFFEKLLEESFLKDEFYELLIDEEVEIEQHIPGIVKLLEECATIYQQALGKD